jgi:hypothetical protein
MANVVKKKSAKSEFQLIDAYIGILH